MVGWPGSGLFQQGHALGIDKSGAAGYTVQVNTAGDTEENPAVARMLTPPIKVTWDDGLRPVYQIHYRIYPAALFSGGSDHSALRLRIR